MSSKTDDCRILFEIVLSVHEPVVAVPLFVLDWVQLLLHKHRLMALFLAIDDVDCTREEGDARSRTSQSRDR